MNRKLIFSNVTLLFVTSILWTGCGKKVDLDQLGGGDNQFPQLSCQDNQIQHWHFVQPGPVTSKVVDLLFVVDTSGSMDDKRQRIADSIPAFISKLPQEVDLRVAVMLAHGGASSHSGRLFAPDGVPLVLRSDQLSTSRIQSLLSFNLANVVPDVDEAEGEMMMYSLAKSMEPNRLKKIQQEGFYRPEAALSIAFISDENDICFPPELNGFTAFPDFSPSPNNVERVGYNKYCKASISNPGGYPAYTYSRLVKFKGNAPLTLAAITHVKPEQVPTDTEEAIGHGSIEFVKQSAGGVLIDIDDPSYEGGLLELGSVTTSKLNLQTRFTLPGNHPLVTSTLRTTVDHRLVNATFNQDSRQLEINPTDAGQANSSIDASACLAP